MWLDTPNRSKASFYVVSARVNGLSRTGSNCLPGAESRGPGPLKIEPAQLSGHVDHFADKVKTGNAPAFHGLGRQFIGIHAASRDLGLLVPFGAGRRNRPAVRAKL